MVPLTPFNLMQREAGSGCSIHVLVRWWARNRLPPEMQQAWARETDRFISMSYDSATCWVDPFCQQILIPHLVDIASDKSGYDLRQILSKIDRSLGLVEKSHGILSLYLHCPSHYILASTSSPLCWNLTLPSVL